MCLNDTNNDDVSKFPITRLGLYFHNTIDTIRCLTAGPEFGLSQAVQKVRCAAQTSDKETAESYTPSSAVSHRVTVRFYAWCAAVWKANGYLPLCDSDKFTKRSSLSLQ